MWMLSRFKTPAMFQMETFGEFMKNTHVSSQFKTAAVTRNNDGKRSSHLRLQRFHFSSIENKMIPYFFVTYLSPFF